MPRSTHGGRHELGQNFLTHTPTITKITSLIAHTQGPILELGAGDGALTKPLSRLGRPLTAIDLDEHRVAALQRNIRSAKVIHADALTYPLTAPTVVGNIPFHLTTPILRRLLNQGSWRQAVLLTQWEVARKRCGVGGSTMLTAQTAPWFTFTLHARVPSTGFNPRPSVDGGIMQVDRRETPLISPRERRSYERFVRAVFTGRGGTLERILQHSTHLERNRIKHALQCADVTSARTLPRDLRPEQWELIWEKLGRRP